MAKKRPQRKRFKHNPKTSPQADVITGTLRMHPRGFGFVIPDDVTLCPQDVFIPRHLTDNAVDGDTVEIAVNPLSNSEKGPEGRILSVVKRGRTHLAGMISSTKERISVHVPILGATRIVLVTEDFETKLKVGDRVILRVEEWGDQKKPTYVQVTHLIGHIEDPSCDIPAAVEEFGLPSDFPEEALKETKAYGSKVKAKDLKERLDFSQTPTFTIDPDTAKDYDDALSISKDRSGKIYLGVHIADVAHYVKPGTALDKEAIQRGNSTYFPGKCLPMLPPALSDQLCSLRQDEIRLTVSVLMTFDKEGTLLSSEICRSFIKSQKRLTYGEAKKILQNKAKSPWKNSLKEMVELCHLLKKKRYERGSIDFALPELIILIDEKGQPYGVKIEEYDITHQLVEEFMLKANEVVAQTLTKRGKSLLYRIHEEPAADNMEDFYDLARSLGFPLPAKPKQKDLQKLFESAKHTTFSQQLAVGFIRNMRLAYYSPENVGHFGLALEHYCHFTSPIRRYSDLVTQRVLFDEEEEGLNLEKVALHCSEQERLSFRAEMSVKLLKKLRLLKKMWEENPTKTYPAIVTRIKAFGLQFEIKELFLEGFLHISELENDYFVYNRDIPALVGKSSGKRHTIGEEIELQLLSLDLIHLECKWELLKKRKSSKRT